MPEAALTAIQPSSGSAAISGLFSSVHRAVTMRTDNASSPASTRSASYPSRLSLGQLWQVPMFCLGVVALIGAAAAHPLLPGNHSQQLGRDLEAARRALEDSPADIERAIAKAELALAN